MVGRHSLVPTASLLKFSGILVQYVSGQNNAAGLLLEYKQCIAAGRKQLLDDLNNKNKYEAYNYRFPAIHQVKKNGF